MKLIADNNWGSITFKLDDVVFDKNVKRVSVKFNNSWKRFDVYWHEVVERVSDMGREHTVWSPIPYVSIEYRGINIPVTLETFKKQEMKIVS